MDQLERLKTFVAVADEGSFAGAARRREMSPPPSRAPWPRWSGTSACH